MDEPVSVALGNAGGGAGMLAAVKNGESSSMAAESGQSGPKCAMVRLERRAGKHLGLP